MESRGRGELRLRALTLTERNSGLIYMPARKPLRSRFRLSLRGPRVEQPEPKAGVPAVGSDLEGIDGHCEKALARYGDLLGIIR